MGKDARLSFWCSTPAGAIGLLQLSVVDHECYRTFPAVSQTMGLADRSFANVSSPPRRGLTLLELLVVLVILLALSTLLIPTIGWLGERSQEVSSLENLHRLREMITNRYMVDMGELPRPRDQLVNDNDRIDHPQMMWLFTNPDTYDDGDSSNDWSPTQTHSLNGRPMTVLSGRQWNGPYLQHSGAEYYVTDSDEDVATGSNFTERYGVGTWAEDVADRVGDPTVVDAWSNPIVLQEPDADDDDLISALERRHTRLVSAGRDGRLDTPPDVLMPTKLERNDDLVLFLFRHDDHGDELLELNDE